MMSSQHASCPVQVKLSLPPLNILITLSLCGEKAEVYEQHANALFHNHKDNKTLCHTFPPSRQCFQSLLFKMLLVRKLIF